MLNKSGYFRTLASMIESTALDFCRKSKKPEIDSYIIDHDFRKIQLKILPLTGYCHIYIDPILKTSHKNILNVNNLKQHLGYA